MLITREIWGKTWYLHATVFENGKRLESWRILDDTIGKRL